MIPVQHTLATPYPVGPVHCYSIESAGDLVLLDTGPPTADARAYLQRYAEVAQHTAESLWLGVRTENQLGDKDQMASYGLKLRAKFPDSEQAKYLQTIE